MGSIFSEQAFDFFLTVRISVFYEEKSRAGDFSDFKLLMGNKKLLFFHQILVAQLFLMKAIIITLIWAALIQGVLLSGLYLFSKKHKSFANLLLGLFLLTIVYEGFTTFIPNESIGSYPLNYYFALPVVKLFYPLLFFHYILEKVGRSERYRIFFRLHYFLAFVIFSFTFVNLALYFGNGQKIEDYLSMDTVDLIFMLQQYYTFLLIIVVLGISIKELNHYKKIVYKNYSDFEMLNIRWLWLFTLSIIPIILAWGFNLVFIAIMKANNDTLELATWFFVFAFMYFVSFQAYKQKNLFENTSDASISENGQGTIVQYKKHNIPSKTIELSEDKVLEKRIRNYMSTNEPYLDASLSIYQLSEQLDMNVRDLSQFINHKLDKHFFDFVNEYRIKKAMEVLADPKNGKMTVLEILYEVGFNSKSSFNTVFKKYTGKTPTQYRKSV